MREGLAFGGLLVTVAAIFYDLGARSCAQVGAAPGGLDLVAGLVLLVAILGVLGVVILWAAHPDSMRGPLP